MFLSQACLLLRVLLVFFPIFIVTSIQIAIFFFVGGVSQAAARQSHECVFFCVVLRQFRQAIFLGLLWAFQEGKGKLVYEASRQASKIEQASKIKEASKQASVFLTASML
jgi:high-affinity K+ transport system ATPase subunit B